MTSTETPQWTLVDEGWGRRAVDFSTLSEPSNCREYVSTGSFAPADGSG